MTITQEKELDIFVGSKIGSLKHVKYFTDKTKNSKKCIENLVDIKSLQKDDAITCMEWGNEDQTEILIAHKNQQVQVYSTIQQEIKRSYTVDFSPGHVVGLGRYKRKYLAASSTGVVRIWSKKEETVIQTGAKLDKMVMCKDEPTLFATGGEENELKVYQIGLPEPTFVAKNLSNDWLQLRQPVWVSGIAFEPDSGGSVLAVCSRHGYVRLYDSRAQRRPVSNVEFPNMAATCITNSFQPRQYLVGFGRGQIHEVDLRASRPSKGYKGSAGAICDIKTAQGLVMSASLDRHLRVHRYDTKELVYQQYLTSKLSNLLVQTASSTPLRCAEDAELKKEEGEEEEDVRIEVGDDMDDLFDRMETISDKTSKKKKAEAEESKEETKAKKIKPSSDGSTEEPEDAIVQLLRSTEKLKRKREKKKKEKKAKSVFHNA